jgi:hypothetical protein
LVGFSLVPGNMHTPPQNQEQLSKTIPNPKDEAILPVADDFGLLFALIDLARLTHD